MVKTDTCTRPEPNLEQPLDNRPVQSARTGNGYNIRGNGYATKPGEGEGI